MMTDGAPDALGPRRASRRAAPAVEAVLATAGLVLLAAACGGSAGSHVAQLASTTARPPSRPGAAAAGGSASSRSPSSQPLAFSYCMRSNGVPSFPDPNPSGVWPKSQVELAAGNPRFQAATQACGRLLPDGGPGVPPSAAVVRQIESDMTRFAGCMRTHGVPRWPEPTLDRGRAVFDPEAAGIDPNSPQVGTEMRECERVFPASVGIPPGA
jgi:hypothetical protein